MDKVKITIIGAGVVGLAIAAQLSHRYDHIVLLEKHQKFGQETSSRNSEVIHSGIYYPTDSLKARLCVEGAELLYAYCEKHSVPFARLGKLIVATEQSETKNLEELMTQGVKNEVNNLELFGKTEINRLEPHVNAVGAIYSPHTGIINTHSFMKHLFHVANASGVIFSFSSKVDAIEKVKDGYVIGIKNDDYKFSSKVVINSAGLWSDCIASLIGLDIDNIGYRLRYCKGTYFSYAKRSPVNILVYPVPHKDLTGLGVHATLDMGRRLRFGPDAEYVESIDYRVDPLKRDDFYKAASKFIRGLEKDSFIPDMAGIRPKIKGEGFRDFIIEHEHGKGLTGLINLIGIESPGITASLAIARHVESIIKEII
jgi:L-2-hydroxyglutarate oxidase LhgO